MHGPDDFGKLVMHYSEAAKAAKSDSHQRMLDGLARFYASLIIEADITSCATKNLHIGPRHPPGDITR